MSTLTSQNTFNLAGCQFQVGAIYHNLPPSSLYEHAIRYDKGSRIAENGALVAYSGAKTGRSPKDKCVVRHPDSEGNVWWGPVNIPCDAQTFAVNRKRAFDFPAGRLTTGMGSTTSIHVSLEDRELVILDTEYAGEMKKDFVC